MDGPQDASIVWTVMTHEHTERTVDWYWGIGLAVLLVIGLSIFFGNYLLAFIVLIGCTSIVMLLVRGPREHTVKIDNRGISLDGTLYRYGALHSFWVERADHPRLLVTTGGIIAPQLIIPLLDERRAQNVRSWLKAHMSEEEQHPHVGDLFAQLFGL